MVYRRQIRRWKLFGIKMILRFNKLSGEWQEIPREERQPTDLYLDGMLKKCLDHYKQVQRKDNDIVLIVSGAEGSGKSTLMANILEYISDSAFDPKKELIGADYLDGLEKIEHTKKQGWLGFDEGNAFFLATETMKREHRDLHKIFSIFRQKNLFVVISLPGFFRIGSYFALDRSAGLLRTYLVDAQRGYFAYYGKKVKDKLYRIGKQGHNENAVRPTFRGRFGKCIKLENEEYKDFKEQTLEDEISKAKDKWRKSNKETLTPKQIEQRVALEVVEKNIEKTGVELGELLNLTPARISQLKRDIKLKNLVKKQLKT